MNAGERDLETLVRMLDPHLSADRYSFAVGDGATLDPGIFALIREDEGATVIRADAGGAWARISLGVQSSLEAVGLTAALSARLARAGISANVIAGFHHDHIFVPWDRRDETLTALKGLSHDAR